MNRILIMVLSYNETPYKELMEAQQRSWDSVKANGVDTMYYHGVGLGKFPSVEVGKCIYIVNPIYPDYSNAVVCACTDSYYFMAEKFKLALDYALSFKWDYLFRTNSSSYVNKEKLKDVCESLPKEKLYAGWTFTDSEDFGGKCVSGAGFWLSRDTAEILRNEIDPDFEMEEDVYCGRILRKHGIVAIDDKSRFDVGPVVSGVPTDRYHYRFKNKNRLMDADNMKILHKFIHG